MGNERDLTYKSIDQIPVSTDTPASGDFRLWWDAVAKEWKKQDASTGDAAFDELAVDDLTVTTGATFSGATIADLGTVTAATFAAGTIADLGTVTTATSITTDALVAGTAATFAGGTIADLGTVSAATAITTTALTIAARPMGRAPVALDATDSITVAEHANRIMYCTTAGAMTWTLPAATGTGDFYMFLMGILATGNHVIVCSETTTHRMIGSNTVADGDTLFLPAAFKPGASDDTFTWNGGTTGGELGDWVKMTDVATNKWLVEGAAQTQTGETPTTPFSNT